MKKFLCEHKLTCILSTLVLLLPLAVGAILYPHLPPNMATHWGADGAADGFSGRAFTVFVLPLILLALHWLCILITALDHKKRVQSKKALRLVFWILPVLSLFAHGVVYATAFGVTYDFSHLMFALFGVLFLVFGNILPKIRQNTTYGIKLPWTVYNEENWNKTHRFGGKVWVVGGLVALAGSLFPATVAVTVLLVVVLVVALVPTLYSYLLYKKQLQDGTALPLKEVLSRKNRIATTVTGILVVFVLIGVAVLMFTGNITVKLDATTFTVKATYYSDFTLSYDQIDTVTLIADDTAGIRTNGFGSARLQLGSYQNDTYGNHTRYAYTGADTAIAVKSGDNTLILSLKTPAETETLYHSLLAKIGQ